MKSPLSHFIFAVSVFAAVGIGYVVLYAGVESKSAYVADLANQIAAKTEIESRAASTRASLAEIENDQTEMQSYFVPEAGVVAFIDDLQAQAQALNATTSILSVSMSSADAQPVLKIALIIKGTFDSVMRAVGAIEYAPYDLSVSALSLEQDDKNAWHANLNLVVGSMSASAATSTP